MEKVKKAMQETVPEAGERGHVAYSRTRAGKVEQIKQKGVQKPENDLVKLKKKYEDAKASGAKPDVLQRIKDTIDQWEKKESKKELPKKGEVLKKPEKEVVQTAKAEEVIGEGFEGFNNLLKSYFHTQTEMKAMTELLEIHKTEMEHIMGSIRPYITKFENLSKEEAKFKTMFTAEDFKYKFNSFTRETKSYQDLYTKAFNMLNDLQKDEMTKAEAALKKITAQERFERTALKAIIDKYIGKPETEELLKAFEEEVLNLLES